ncbi:hypothetical protein QKU48_gp0485 [Fadolivirus algeromassiliense]|jgi:hypothetical protein|uniref:Uncharacterized protein n=1 Tax=Fadolivirus FV1/VV64 TaxID=3070911 RepID=A0A7D3QU96_9VIRU|nr:hypothetical protein QKU48_gp0485 [Fadolivirus algeromassiliense]QKF93943.1 hypothetical protein Fadolivirus_1_485 [Fadolivirus FV1/VV64]
MSNLLDNEFIAVVVALFIGLYALNLGKMKLPTYIKNLFNNTLFRIVFLSLMLVYRFDNSPHVALTVALVFVLTLDYLSTEQIKENFEYYEAFKSQLNN